MLAITLGGTSKGRQTDDFPNAAFRLGECTKGVRRDDIVLVLYYFPETERHMREGHKCFDRIMPVFSLVCLVSLCGQENTLQVST